MRTLFLGAAAAHALLVGCQWLPVDIMILAVAGVIAALVVGGVVLVRNGPIASVWVGTAASLTALIGWGSWLVIWALDPSRSDPAINIIGVLLPPVAVIVYLVAAFLPSTRRGAAR
ncbi:hypothetical protein [Corynebacterium sp.]|uniref:hypothetical protein n=1 Tax=Corynebacterium sp. TaxID=1720 RepID=UPI0026DEC4CE|nr:hypothetical protein [Corynebacterium sp.]MDO5511874.1 hypothetical protein [Corynebacterium sp.]